MLGLKHPDVATSINNLTGLLRGTNRLAEAEPLYRRAPAIGEKSFGPEHPNVGTGLNNADRRRPWKKRWVQIIPAWQKTSTTWPSSFAPPTGSQRQSPLMWRALEIDEKSYGLAHPNLAIHLNNLAQLFKDTRRLDAFSFLFAMQLTV